MKKKLIIAGWLTLILFLQVTILDYIKIFNTKPDITLAAVIIISLCLELKWALIFGWFAAILKDVFSVLPFGLNISVLPLIAFLVFKLSRKITIDTKYTIAGIILSAVILKNLLISAAIFVLGRDISLGMVLRIAMIDATYTTLLYLIFSKAIKISAIAPRP